MALIPQDHEQTLLENVLHSQMAFVYQVLQHYHHLPCEEGPVLGCNIVFLALGEVVNYEMRQSPGSLRATLDGCVQPSYSRLATVAVTVVGRCEHGHTRADHYAYNKRAQRRGIGCFRPH